MSYTHLTEKERYVISHLKIADYPLREIARLLSNVPLSPLCPFLVLTYHGKKGTAMKASMKWLVLVCIWLVTACGGNSSNSSPNPDSAAKLTNAPAGAFSPEIAVAGDGKAIAVWSEGPVPFSLWVNHYNPASGWGTAERIGTGTGHEAWAQIAVNSSGSAVLAWGRRIDNSINLLAATYNPATGWSQPTVLEGTTLVNPQVWVSIDDNGVASVSWQTFAPDAGYNVLRRSKYISNAWISPETVASNTSTTGQTVSANASGKSFAIYNQHTPDPVDPLSRRYNTFVRSFDSALGWSAPQAIGNDVSELGGAYYNPTTTPGHYKPTISVDDQGNALALWSEVYYAGSSYLVTVNNFEAAAGWGTPLKIGEIPADSTFTSSPFVSDEPGTSYISLLDCQYSYNSTLSNIFVVKFKAGTWSFEKVVDSVPSYVVDSAITVGKDGALLLTWLQLEGDDAGLRMKRYDPVTGWGPASRVDNLPGGVYGYDIARDASGRVFIMWSQSGETSGGVYVRNLQ